MTTFGYFGKIPSEPDFVRHAAASAVAQAFQAWVQSGIEALAGASKAPFAQKFAFMPESPSSLFGVSVPSRDKIGRSFPFSIFAECERAGRNLKAQIVSSEPLIAAMSLAVEEAQKQENGSLGRIIIEKAEAFANGHSSSQIQNAALDETIPKWFARLFSNRPEGQQFYAIHVLALARDVRRWRKDSSQHLTLLFPIEHQADLLRWLELVSEVFAGACSIASVSWTEKTLAVSLSQATGQSFLALAAPNENVNRVWPIWTDRSNAVALASDALSPLLRNSLATDARFEALLETIRLPSGAGGLR